MDLMVKDRLLLLFLGRYIGDQALGFQESSTESIQHCPRASDPVPKSIDFPHGGPLT